MQFTLALAAESDFERLLLIRHAAMRPSLEHVGRWYDPDQPTRQMAYLRALPEGANPNEGIG